MNITDTWLKKVNGEARQKTDIFNDDKRDGLAARISPKGKITFQYRYYYTDKATGKGKQRRIDLGAYPKTGIAAARLERDRLAEFLDKGEDPKTIRQTEKINIVNRATVEEIFNGWLACPTAKKRASNEQHRARIESWVYGEFGGYQFDQIITSSWIGFMERMAGARPEAARAILSEIKQASRWAKKSQLIDNLPLQEFSAQDFGIVRQKVNRILADWELALIYDGLEDSGVYIKNRVMFRLAIFFGCRIGELRLAERSHFDLKKRVWTVPPEISKTGQAIKRPIIDEIMPEINLAFDLSKSARYLFPKAKGAGAGVEPSKANFQITIPYRLTDFINKKYLAENKRTVNHWTTHDLRRTARTNWEQLKIEERVSEKMLGHTLQGVLAHYNHYDYLDEMAAAYRQWFYKLEKIQGRAGNVTPLVIAR